MPCAIPGGQSAAGAWGIPLQRSSPTESAFAGYRLDGPWRSDLHLCCRLFDFSPGNTSLKLLPFATAEAFGILPLANTRPDVIAVFSSTRLPGFSGCDFLTTTGSSATSHRVGSFLSCLLKLPTDPIGVSRRLPDDARLPQLLCWLPVNDYVLNHLLSLFMYRASCLFAHSPR